MICVSLQSIAYFVFVIFYQMYYTVLNDIICTKLQKYPPNVTLALALGASEWLQSIDAPEFT